MALIAERTDAFVLPRFEAKQAQAERHPADDGKSVVRIELGRTTLTLEEAKQLAPKAIVQLQELDRDPVNVYANDRLAARGEVVVMQGRFCVRITEVVD